MFNEITPEEEFNKLQEIRKQEAQAQQLKAQQIQQAKQQPQSGGMPLGMASQFMGGGASGAGGAGGGASSGLMAAAPWVALGAGIYANESNARDKGFRSEDDTQYAKDLASGKVLSQDLEQRIIPKVFGENDKTGMGADTKAGVDLANFRVRDAWKGFKEGSLAKALRKIF
jgi:hypothetical protein